MSPSWDIATVFSWCTREFFHVKPTFHLPHISTAAWAIAKMVIGATIWNKYLPVLVPWDELHWGMTFFAHPKILRDPYWLMSTHGYKSVTHRNSLGMVAWQRINFYIAIGLIILRSIPRLFHSTSYVLPCIQNILECRMRHNSSLKWIHICTKI